MTTILGNVKVGKYYFDLFNILVAEDTLEGITAEEEIALNYDFNNDCIEVVISDFRKQMLKEGRRGNVSLKQLQEAKTNEELRVLLEELFLDTVHTQHIEYFIEKKGLDKLPMLYDLHKKKPEKRFLSLLKAI